MTDTKQDDDAGLNPLAVIEAVAPEGWKQKLGRVAVQLGIGTRKGAQLYAAGRDQIDTSEGKSIISKAMAEALAREAVQNPLMMERARARFLGDFISKQENLEAVMIGAANHLNDDDAPEPLLLTDEIKETEPSPTAEERNEEAAPLSGDWAAAFTREAEGATSEELRDRLSRVLAGEIRAPGTYPRGVIRLVAELERSDIEAMQESLPFRLDDAIFHLDSPDTERIARLLKLADAGLVADAGAGLTMRYGFTAKGDLFESAQFGKTYGLVILKDSPSEEMRAFAPLNRAGQAIADLLDPDSEHEKQALIALAKTFEANCVEIALVKITSKGDNLVNYNRVEFIKSRSTALPVQRFTIDLGAVTDGAPLTPGSTR